MDLIKFCQEARKVFVDSNGNDIRTVLPSRLLLTRLIFPGWVSFRVFLRITWGPFETKFDDTRGRLDDRMLVVSRTASATDQERMRAESQQKSQEAAGNGSPTLLA